MLLMISFASWFNLKAMKISSGGLMVKKLCKAARWDIFSRPWLCFLRKVGLFEFGQPPSLGLGCLSSLMKVVAFYLIPGPCRIHKLNLSRNLGLWWPFWSFTLSEKLSFRFRKQRAPRVNDNINSASAQLCRSSHVSNPIPQQSVTSLSERTTIKLMSSQLESSRTL